jgi:hypothetical protein
MMKCCAWAAFPAVIAALPLTSGAQESQTSAITIERIEPGRWRATYTFSDPVTSLRFVRGAANHRERVWAVVTPGLSRHG